MLLPPGQPEEWGSGAGYVTRGSGTGPVAFASTPLAEAGRAPGTGTGFPSNSRGSALPGSSTGSTTIGVTSVAPPTAVAYGSIAFAQGPLHASVVGTTESTGSSGPTIL